AYFATTFAVRGTPQAELTNLLRIRDEYIDALARLSVPTDNAALRDALAAIDTSPELNALNELVQERIDRSLQLGVPDALPPMSFTSVMADVEALQVVYGASQTSTDTHLALVDATTREVLDRAAGLRNRAGAEVRAWYLFTALLAAVSCGAAAAATRFIVRPLGTLREAANRLRAGALTSIERPAGPVEVRAATSAINDAAAHLDLATRQAQALAAGELDDAVFDEREQSGLGRALQDAVRTLRDALTQQDEFRRRLAHEAAHDGLTRLPNRNASMVQLARSIARTTRADTQLAVLFIDLDHFKEVNDHHGHQAGDTVLTTVADRLIRNVREGDHVGRLGGDEFVVIAEPVSGHQEAVELAERLRQAIELPIDIRTTHVHVGASIGIAFATEDLTADELLRDADLAVYRVKDLGRGGVEICDEDLRAKMVGDADLSNALRHAIAHDELLLHYQPIVEAGTGVVRGFEALVRWRRPTEDRLVPPDQFIPVAERSALIIDLDRWVLRSAAEQIASWDRAGVHAGLPVSINVSSRHLGHEHFVRHVMEPLGDAGVAPQRIIIEVTETALLNDLAGAAEKLQRLRRNGVRIAIDDFGTGYTSLAHLRSLPVDILKIDRSFTAQILTSDHDASIVQLIIDTGHLLGAAITVEGVETGDEAAKLVQLGSDSLQGYYFARPQPPEMLTQHAHTDAVR
ncbi:MAG: putative bifunctional diguanylate cyclase/phosphodiesterase, partial [Acidimicrobiia bacterium]